MFQSNSQKPITKVLIIVVSSPNNCGGIENIWLASQKVKLTGIVVFVLVVGDRVDRTELLIMSSGGSNIFHIEYLSKISTYLRLITERSLYCTTVFNLIAKIVKPYPKRQSIHLKLRNDY
ncbi:hypothetical protein MXB_3785 [Myxobolus squamalis]|nr:hypothetical protein MXB_3785 [Myxobolus squamalis]